MLYTEYINTYWGNARMEPRKKLILRKKKASPAGPAPTEIDVNTWKPNDSSVETILTTITANFESNKKSPLLNPKVREAHKPQLPEATFMLQCAKVGAFLMNKNVCYLHLLRLNECVAKKIAKNEPGDVSVSLLREVLEEELTAMGFHRHFAKSLENIRPEIFRAVLDSGIIIKDAIIGDTPHGEFSHAIQILMIAWQQQASNFIGIPAVEFIKLLAAEDAVFYRDTLELERDIGQRRAEKSIWDLILDNESVNDFRSPEALHTYLQDNSQSQNDKPQQSLKVLKELIQMRVAKRKADEGSERFLEKYKQVPSDGSTKLFPGKGKKPGYVAGKIEGLLTHLDSEIDLETFKKKS